MIRTVVILAAGESRRWRDGIWPDRGPKQLLEVGGETLIARVVRQVRARGHEPTVITHNPEIVAAVPDARIYATQTHRWIIETLWSSKAIWRGLVTVLYSDTVYSAAVMDGLLNETREPMFWGRWGDMFGWVFRADDARYIEGCQAVLDSADEQLPSKDDVARSWQLYRWLQGWDLYQHVGPNESNALYEFVPHTDYTHDVDTGADWEHFQRFVIDAGRLDDLPVKVGA